MSWDDLDIKQKMFVHYYTDETCRETFNNAAQSALRATYSPGAHACEILKIPAVAEEITKRQEAIVNSLRFDKAMVLGKHIEIIDKLSAIDILKYNVSDIIKSLQEVAKLKGLNEPNKLDITATETEYRDDLKKQMREYAKEF